MWAPAAGDPQDHCAAGSCSSSHARYLKALLLLFVHWRVLRQNTSWPYTVAQVFACPHLLPGFASAVLRASR